MSKLIDADKLSLYSIDTTDLPTDKGLMAYLKTDVDNAPTVDAIPKEEVRQFIENIQKIKDNHNEYGEPINYGTICGILIEGYRLLDKYMESEDGNK